MLARSLGDLYVSREDKDVSWGRRRKHCSSSLWPVMLELILLSRLSHVLVLVVDLVLARCMQGVWHSDHIGRELSTER
jgi:hypothetical protein